ncbi:hypothetical protein MW887_008192 [Aspergillus wentii]|nr:hypothetical protein MW887_008192 [Aspergillus wentii]
MSQRSVQSVILITEPGKAEIHHDLPIPTPNTKQLLIRIHAVSLNPSDSMALHSFAKPGSGMGFDFSGIVDAVGPECTDWSIGDRVAGLVHGCYGPDYTIGAFREYITVDAEMVIRVPDHLDLSEASTLGMGVSTAAQGLYQSLKLQLPHIDAARKDETVLIYGGGTATGYIAVQLAKLSGYRVITTCSKHSMDRIRLLNPDEIVDYTHPDAVAMTQKLVRPNGLSLILDCVANDSTAAFCYQCFSPQENQPCIHASLMPINNIPSHAASMKITNKFNLVYTCFGKEFNLMGQTWEASELDRKFMISFYRRMERLLEQGQLRLMPVDIRNGGLKGVLEGVSELNKDKGRKLVYIL